MGYSMCIMLDFYVKSLLYICISCARGLPLCRDLSTHELIRKAVSSKDSAYSISQDLSVNIHAYVWKFWLSPYLPIQNAMGPTVPV
jgi:hypothetical protein